MASVEVGPAPTLAGGVEEAQAEGGGAASVATTSGTADRALSAYQVAHERWKAVNFKGSMLQWDETFGHVVSNRENNSSDRHRLVTFVRDFTKQYKAEPSSELVDSLLKYIKKYVQSLYERCEVAEQGFLAVYQAVQNVPDPAPLLFAAHLELASRQRTISQLEQESREMSENISDLRKKADRAKEEGAMMRMSQHDETSSSEFNVAEVEQLRKTVAALERDCEVLRADNTKLYQNLRSSQDALLTATYQLEATRSSGDQRLEDLDREVRELSDEVAALRGRNSALESQLRSTNQDNESAKLEEDLAAANSQICDLQTQCHEFGCRVDALERRNEALEKENTQLRESVEKQRGAEAPCPSAALAGADVSTPTAAMLNRIHELEDNLALAKRSKEEQRTMLEASELTIANLRNKVTQLEEALQAQQAGASREPLPGNGVQPISEKPRTPSSATVPAILDSGGAALLSDEDFSVLLGEPTARGRMTIPASEHDGASDLGGSIGPEQASSSDGATLRLLLAQKERQKQKILEQENKVSQLRDELISLRSQCDCLHSDNIMLLKRLSRAPTTTRSVDNDKYIVDIESRSGGTSRSVLEV